MAADDPPSFNVTEGGAAVTHQVVSGDDVLAAPDTEGEKNTVKAALIPLACFRVEDIRFAFGSSFVLPEVKGEMPILADLRTQHKQGDLLPPISIFGHADPVGDDNTNKLLSGRRAAAIFALLTRDTTLWEDLYSNTNHVAPTLATDRWGPEAIQVMLNAVGSPPGRTDGVVDKPTRDAVEDFQGNNGLAPKAAAGPDPTDKPTREKLFFAYMEFLCGDLKLDGEGDFLAKGSGPDGKGRFQGCSEFNPLLLFSQQEENQFAQAANQEKRNQENAPNRRVVVFLYRPGTHVTASRWPCPTVKEGVTKCVARFWSDGEKRRKTHLPVARRKFEESKDTFACRFYHRMADGSPCENPGWLGLKRPLRVFLRLVYKDPDPALPNRPFPPDFPVVVTFPGGTQNAVVGDNGLLTFAIGRDKKEFTLRFGVDKEVFIASADPAAKDDKPERTAFTPEIKSLMDQKFRVFSLPKDWGLTDADWTLTDTTDFDKGTFKNLETGVTIGATDAPREMVLDPHWQYTQFQYFDRALKKKLSLTPVMIEGVRKVTPSAAGDAPDTRSNWTLGADGELVQCLPWILRKDATGKDEPKPDKLSVLSLRSLGGTFVEAQADGTRRLVTTTPPADPATASVRDPGVNTGTALTDDLKGPSLKRMRFYDLPGQWMSRVYFARLSGGKGQPPAKQGIFNDLAAEVTAPAKPIQFSLDDIVLLDETGAAFVLAAEDRVAVFSHRFGPDPANANVGRLGIFKPDGDDDPDTIATSEPFFSKKEVVLPLPGAAAKEVYIHDYPDWSRLVIAKGELFDAFDQRTTQTQSVVGARAAVRWVKSAGVLVPPNEQENRPTVVTKPFYAQQPYYEQRHDAFFTDKQGDDRGIGRCDMALLRCCDIEKDASGAESEAALCMQYFRFFFHFNLPKGERVDSEKDSEPSTLSGDDAKKYIRTNVLSICRRWNGPDSHDTIRGKQFFTKGPGVLVSEDAALPLRVRVFWFAQHLPKEISHFDLRVFKDIRASMASDSGLGRLKEGAIDVTFFTAAHETGHGGSHPDEYIEETVSPNKVGGARIPSFESFSPGSAYFTDSLAMMRTNREIRSRYFWHNAEWVRAVDGKSRNFHVEHDGFKYKLPHHPKTPSRSFMHFPLASAIDAKQGKRGHFDIFVCPLGEDKYSKVVLPLLGRSSPSSADAFDGLVIVEVRMEWVFDIKKLTDIGLELDAVQNLLSRKFNNRFRIKGNAGGHRMERCLFHVSPRFHAKGHATEDPDKDRHFRVKTRASGKLEWDDGIFGLSSTLLYSRVTAEGQLKFPPFFGEMMGIDGGAIDTPASYLPIVRKVIPDAQIEAIP